jgi:hypothetical protein
MTGVETLLWLVLAFADGSDCLLQGSFHWLPEGQVFVREDGCSVRSQQEGRHVVFWSNHRWVAVRIPSGAKSLSYRWGRAVAHVNGDSVKVEYGTILGEFQSAPSVGDPDRLEPLQKWRVIGMLAYRRAEQSRLL